VDPRVAVLADGHVLRIQDLRARLDSLVLARQVHPEVDAAYFGSGLALPTMRYASRCGLGLTLLCYARLVPPAYHDE
jgi:hypothetical protein